MFLLSFLLIIPTGSASDDGQVPSVRLRVDYATTFVYMEDPARINVSVIGRMPKTVNVRLAALAPRADGKEVTIWTRNKQPQGAGSISFVIGVEDRNRATQYEIVLSNGERSPDKVSFRVLRAYEKLPLLDAGPLGLQTSGGLPCILFMQHRVARVDKRWLPVKFVIRLLKKKHSLRSVRLISDLPLAPPGKAWGDKIKPLLTSPGRKDVTIFRAVARVTRVRKLGRRESVVVFLGTRDIQLGTRERDFRMGLEAILQHLESCGASDIRLVIPLSPTPYRARGERYHAIVEKLAVVYHAKALIRLTDQMKPSFWVDDKAPGVLLRTPPLEKTHALTLVLLRNLDFLP